MCRVPCIKGSSALKKDLKFFFARSLFQFQPFLLRVKILSELSQSAKIKNIGKLSDFIAVYIRLLAYVAAFFFLLSLILITLSLTGFGRRLTNDDFPFIVCSFVISR